MATLLAIVFDHSIGYFYAIDDGQTFILQDGTSYGVFNGVYEYTQLQTEIASFISSYLSSYPDTKKIYVYTFQSCKPIKHTYGGIKKLTPIAIYASDLSLITGIDILNIPRSEFDTINHYTLVC